MQMRRISGWLPPHFPALSASLVPVFLSWCPLTFLSPCWSPLPAMRFLDLRFLQGPVQVSLPWGRFSCTAFSGTSPSEARAPREYLQEGARVSWKALLSPLSARMSMVRPSASCAGTQWDSLNVYPSQGIFREGYAWLLRNPK